MKDERTHHLHRRAPACTIATPPGFWFSKAGRWPRLGRKRNCCDAAAYMRIPTTCSLEAAAMGKTKRLGMLRIFRWITNTARGGGMDWCWHGEIDPAALATLSAHAQRLSVNRSQEPAQQLARGAALRIARGAGLIRNLENALRSDDAAFPDISTPDWKASSISHLHNSRIASFR